MVETGPKSTEGRRIPVSRLEKRQVFVPVVRITGDLFGALADLPDAVRTSPRGLDLQRICLEILRTVSPEVNIK